MNGNEEMTAEQFIEFMEGRAAAAKANKFGAVRTVYEGKLYASKTEARYASMLDMLVRGGEITSWTRQPKYLLGDLAYHADFEVTGKDGKRWVVDVKGHETPRFRMVRRLWPKYGQLPLHVVHKGEVEVIEGYKD